MHHAPVCCIPGPATNRPPTRRVEHHKLVGPLAGARVRHAVHLEAGGRHHDVLVPHEGGARLVQLREQALDPGRWAKGLVTTQQRCVQCAAAGLLRRQRNKPRPFHTLPAAPPPSATTVTCNQRVSPSTPAMAPCEPPHLGHALELVLGAGRHAVPHLGRAPVQEVDRVQVSVLLVPPEERAPHAEVRHGRRDACGRGQEAASESAILRLPLRPPGCPFHPPVGLRAPSPCLLVP